MTGSILGKIQNERRFVIPGQTEGRKEALSLADAVHHDVYGGRLGGRIIRFHL
jgi:hypothetical protein